MANNASTIWVGNDHGGLELKRALMAHIPRTGWSVRNIGSDAPDIVRYPHYAARVAGAVARGEAARGILICSTGIGMSIMANKFKGVRAALCTNVHMAKMTRAHNDSNVLCLGGRITSEADALAMLDVWLTTPYEGGRHDISLGLIAQAEAVLMKPAVLDPFETDAAVPA